MSGSSLRLEMSWMATISGLHAVLAAVPGARLVGGCVRDRMAGRVAADIDLATPDSPERVIARLEAAGLRAIPTGIAHGTVTALSDGRGFEITTLRRDVETDGRHALVAFTDDWREDAARRDFTINAMSLTPEGELYDYFGGLADLKAGRVRFVGVPSQRIAEDYLRILRYFRFFARYATMIDDAAVAAISQGVPGLARLSAERVWSELQRILGTPAPDRALELMAQTGVLRAVVPEAMRVRVDALPALPVLRLAALVRGETAAVAARLKLSGEEAALLHALQGPAPSGDDADLTRLLADIPASVLMGRVWLAGGDAGLRARLAALPVPVFPVQGRDLIAAGLRPGPELGQSLARLRAWWLEGGCVAEKASVLAQLALPPAS